MGSDSIRRFRRSKRSRFVAVAATLLLGAQFAGSPAYGAVEEQGRLPLEELRTFADVYHQIRMGYVEEIDDSTLLEYAIQGMLMGLDPHSTYLTEDAFENLQSNTSGEFTGLGLEVGMEDGYVKIISPIDGSPAAAAGLESDDVILKLDNAPVKGMSLNEAIEIMRGPKGTEIKLTIGRPGTSQPFDVTLVRDVIKVASVRKRWLEPGYGYIRVAQFQNQTGQDVRGALEKLMAEQKLKGLVLDLRNNPGGLLRASIDVAGLFMDGGNVVYTEGRIANADMHYDASPDDSSNGTPLIVLINRGSASASEIVAGALQDHGRAVIMGTQSFGKGSVQTVLPLSESRAVKLTTALYFTPNGRSIQAEGIVPDIEVERAKVTAYDNSQRITEADLSGHLDNANGDGNDTKASGRKVDNKLLATDNQLYEALTLLKGLNVLGCETTGKPQKAVTPDQARKRTTLPWLTTLFAALCYTAFASSSALAESPLPVSCADAPPPQPESPRIVIIIDDLGHNFRRGQQAVELPGNLTYAVIPFTSHGSELADAAHAAGKEVMLHAPMSTLEQTPLGTGGLTPELSRQEFLEALDAALKDIPHVQGVNNHMGSDLTRRRQQMAWLMRELRWQDLYFVDSRTNKETVAATVAAEFNVPHLSRQVFLDNEQTQQAIGERFELLLSKAEKEGLAVAIGHPYRETIAFLATALPLLPERGVELVSVSEALAREDSAALTMAVVERPASCCPAC